MSDVLVLCYHAVSPRWPADLSVTPEAFERQLQLLVGRGYRGATFHDAVTSPADGPSSLMRYLEQTGAAGPDARHRSVSLP